MSSRALWTEVSPSRSETRSRIRRSRSLGAWPFVSLLALSACGGAVDEPDTSPAASTTEAVSLHAPGQVKKGEQLFDTAFADTNGRSCATCHVRADHTVLTPAHVTERLAAAPTDPLFNRLDADDPLAAEPTYEHLKKGLVRVTITLPDNMDLLDFSGNVVTTPDRTIAVWRAVPTVENTAITAPYQYDGRKATLQEQAQGAISSHSQGPLVSKNSLNAIAAFQGEQFTSPRAQFVATLFEQGVPVEHIPRPELYMPLTPAQARGRELYNSACEGCHGGSTTRQITNRELHAIAFPELKRDGNVLYDTSVQPPKPVLANEPNNEFLNIGLGNISYLGQIYGDFFGPRFNASVQLPQYRFRFYTDGTRTVQTADLPPIPVTASGFPFDLQAAIDENGAPIVGPNFLPQMWSTDPGRAAITGNPHDFEGFDVPALRGIVHTAPYFHDNSVETLRGVVDIYSRFILNFFAPLHLPTVNPPEPGSFFPESLTPQQKDDLMEFLTIL